MCKNISIRAGRKAFAILQDEGLALERVKVLAGASGAAKYLVLTGIDRLLFSLFSHRSSPLFLIGTSIGAFRMACYSHPDPQGAYTRLQEAYIHQSYPQKPTAQEVSKKSKAIVDAFISDAEIAPILNHPTMRLNFLSNRCKGLLASDRPYLLAPGLVLAALTNLASRNALKWYFERALFSVPKAPPPFASMDQFPMQSHILQEGNFKKALLSSGSIPIVMQSVDDINGIDGIFRDGGILDYHLDIPFLPQEDERLVLYPHFYPHIIPGWFDKSLKRQAKPIHLDNVVLISPSEAFVKSLPFQKIPDRSDFKSFHQDDNQRIRYWETTVDMSRRLGDELHDLIASGNIANTVKPI
jgi:hypothetical protein